MADLAILIPFRGPESGKSRLGPALGDTHRAAIALALFRRTLTVTTRLSGASAVLVVTPSAHAARLAEAAGAQVLRDRGFGLNGACALGLATLAKRGVLRAVILPADLPAIDGESLASLCCGRRDEMRLAADDAGTGTNGLSLPLHRRFPTEFGEDSFARHVAVGQEAGLCPVPVRDWRLSFDLDRPAQLARWQRSQVT